MKNILKFFNCESNLMLHRTEELHNALTHLQYEGRMFRLKNIKSTRKAIRNLDVFLRRHRHLQEKVIFPFFQIHIPRFETAIHFLETEHEDIRKNKQKLEDNISKQSPQRSGLNNGKAYESGIYLISLLRHHIGFENRNIYKIIQKSLRENEKKALKLRINKWLKKEAGHV